MPIPTPPSYDHGSTGTEPSQARDYQDGDPLDPDELDYYLNTEFTKLDEIIQALTELKDGTIQVASAASADTATDADNVTGTYKGNDIDSDGDGDVDMSDQTKSVEVRTDDPSTIDGRVWIRSDL